VDRVVTIRPEIAKTNRRRFINLSQNAVEWLQAYTGDKTGAVAKLRDDTLADHRKANRRRAGVTHWPNSAMRHTFCSNWLAEHGDINQLVLMSGHTSVNTMWNHYHRGTRKEDAKEFWSILPPKTAESVIPIAKVS
jgi:integrase